jgi:hypothetical protein
MATGACWSWAYWLHWLHCHRQNLPATTGGGQRLRVMRGRDPMWRRAKQCDEKPIFPSEDTEIACFASAAFHK